MSGCKTKAAPAVPVTPKSTYTGPVVVDPITRIEGHLRIEVEVENGKVAEVRSSSQLFRGLEIILKGRDPRDAQHFTQRSCGVCTYTHALASTRCVDNAVKVNIPPNATLMRNLVLAAQYMHDHIVHFYHLHALDWVSVSNALNADPKKTASLANSLADRKETPEYFKAVQDKVKALVDSGQLGPFTNAYFLGGHDAYYLPAEADLMATADYLKALHLQVKAARAMAVFGAKNPHTQFTVVGGVTNYDGLTQERIAEFAALYEETKDFVAKYYIPDLLAVAGFYKDWAGIGGTTNFLSFGDFPAPGGEFDLNSRWWPQGVIFDRNIGGVKDFDPTKIEEHVKYSWYKYSAPKHPYNGVTEPQYTELGDKNHYSWMKAPRYDGRSTEVGPLAHCLVAYGRGHKEIKAAVDMVLGKLNVGPAALFSTLGRTAARGIECYVTAVKTADWLNALKENVAKGDSKIYQEWEMPDEAEGVGYVNAPRGGLSHWIKIKNKKIKNFQLVVPSTWNLGPRDDKGVLSPVEEALMNTPIADPKRPVEILRTVHSYDPCIACGVHVIDNKTGHVAKFRIL
ncbi:MAG: nickel-dependent hydrogenase large subunit [Desulfovibrionaceae bacterium]|nr:nickel-dependent hydrogenase large subunit [Desulfovibrionaceae bacterium]